MFVSHSLDDITDLIELAYHPEFGRMLDNGNLFVRFSGVADDGEKVDCAIEVASDHPCYNDWLHTIQNSEEILQARHQKEKQEREERRRLARERHAGENP